jgi:hypothetical protein
VHCDFPGPLVTTTRAHLLLCQFLNTHLFQIPAPTLFVQPTECQSYIERWIAKTVRAPDKTRFGWNLGKDPGGTQRLVITAHVCCESLCCLRCFSESEMPRSFITTAVYIDLNGDTVVPIWRVPLGCGNRNQVVRGATWSVPLFTRAPPDVQTICPSNENHRH